MWHNGFHNINTSVPTDTRKRADQIAGGVFLIGLAVLFMSGDFFPGILIVIGLSALSKEAALGKRWQSSGALGLVGVGLVFAFGFSLPLLLIGIGVAMLMGFQGWNHWSCGSDNHDGDGKGKNDFKPKRHEYSDNGNGNDVVVVGKSFQA
ncbi:MAG: hypothetical protein H7175_02430 [Burkholderiales bacterium]|nr:hypothetical protein [Anaerolineae bacterium]